ncbi:MAG: 2-hydroxyglutaryl-CoA dehydratase [Deltaproteobacteria bacterium]|nr:2-hydroxyglutaryl-CoA dehydratase [Deltaproteobacteria bacterium]
MIVLGCDVGALATKTVLLNNGELLGWDITPNVGRLGQVAEESLSKVLRKTGLTLEQIALCWGTGWGKKYIPYPHSPENLINCLSRGARWLWPAVRTVVDIGGLTTTVIHLKEQGGILEYRNNDRCASGTGFFIELAAQALELPLDELDSTASRARGRAHIGAQCAVFGESEIISHVNDGVEPAEIVAGLTYAVGLGAATMVRRLGIVPDILMTGGVTKIRSVVWSLEENLATKTCLPDCDPQIVAAIGAALAGADGLQGQVAINRITGDPS